MKTKNMNKHFLGVVAVAALMGFTSCSEDVAVNSSLHQADRPITFTTTVEATTLQTRAAGEAISLSGEGRQLWLLPSVTSTEDQQRAQWNSSRWQTRGTQIRDVADMQSFGVSAFRHAKTDANLSNATPSYFYNLEATKSGDDYIITQNHFWPSDDDVLDFQAYHPYNDENITLSGKDATGDQTIRFTVNSDVRKQCDLMTATAQDETFKTSLTPAIPLKFYHRLCAVRFVVGDQFVSQGYIKTITLKGVYKTGTYTLGSAVGEGWTPDAGSKTDFELQHNTDKKLTGAVSGDDILDTDETFLMIPQDFTGDAETASIEVLYWDGTADIKVTASLKGQVWEEGSTVTYALSSQKLTTLQVSSIQFPATVAGAPKTAWEAGDQVGLYVVDALADGTGTELVYTNIPVTYTATGGWSVGTAQGTLYHKPTYLYYFYYPYKAGDKPDGYPEESPKADATGEEFFASIINAWTLNTSTTGNHADQGDLDKFKAADLQVARAELDAPVSTVKATMRRQVGLARFRFATSKTIPETITYTNNSNRTTSGSVTIAPSTTFLNNKAYLSGGIYYFWTKADETATFNSNPSDVNHWKEALNIRLAAGAYTADADMVTVQDYRNDWTFATTATYIYTSTGNAQTFTVTDNCTATMECWGADGGPSPVSGNASAIPGKGGYTKGDMLLAVDNILYVYVGGVGKNNVSTLGGYNEGGWNGGGISSYNISGASYEPGSGGGGATDIRLVRASATDNKVWNTVASLRTRIMVAGGGGGCGYMKTGASGDAEIGGCGGGLIGGSGTSATRSEYSTENAVTLGGTQISAPRSTYGPSDEKWQCRGAFGYASQTLNDGSYYGCGGGGGWYGGQKGGGNGGAGGSSFISGHLGCNPVNTSTGEHLGAYNGSNSSFTTYSGTTYRFTNTSMIDGDGKEWTTATQTRTYQSGSAPSVTTGSSVV